MAIRRNLAVFEKLWLGSVAIGVLVAALDYSTLSKQYNAFFVLFIQFSVLIFTLLMILLVSRKNSKFAKYTLLIFFVIGIVLYVPILGTMIKQKGPWILSALQYFMQTIGIYYLFFQDTESERLSGIAKSSTQVTLDAALDCLESGDCRKAITIFNHIIKTSPQNYDAYSGRGICFIRIGKHQEGIKDIDYAAANGNVPAKEFLKGSVPERE